MSFPIFSAISPADQSATYSTQSGSLFSTVFFSNTIDDFVDFLLSFGSKNKLNWIFSPRLPYRVDPNNIFKNGNSELIEVPLSALIMPYLGTTMRIFPLITSLQRRILHLETTMNNKPIVFDIHPNEFIDESNEPRVIKRRSKNILQYILKDYIRTKLKSKNLGYKAIPLYTREIEFFKIKDYNFLTIKDYCVKKNFL